MNYIIVIDYKIHIHACDTPTCVFHCQYAICAYLYINNICIEWSTYVQQSYHIRWPEPSRKVWYLSRQLGRH